MTVIKDADKKFPDLAVAKYGQVDIGVLQGNGTVTAAATHASGTELTLDTNEGDLFQVGQVITIAGTTDYNGSHKILAIDGDDIVIGVAYVSDQSGTWNLLSTTGTFYGFMPMNADLAADAITSITYDDDTLQHGDATQVKYLEGVFYPFPALITAITIASGDIRLVRFSEQNQD